MRLSEINVLELILVDNSFTYIINEFVKEDLHNYWLVSFLLRKRFLAKDYDKQLYILTEKGKCRFDDINTKIK